MFVNVKGEGMNLINNVYEIAEQFMSDSEWVKINYENLSELARTMTSADPPKFPLPVVTDSLKGVVMELVAASINYCYWYGKSTVRPNGASSTVMYELLDESFYNFIPNAKRFSSCIDTFVKHLAIQRFPLLEERIKHLNELKNGALDFCNEIDNCYTIGMSRYHEFEDFFKLMIISFPGFASDIFLKRASLFFIQLNRRFGWFKEELKMLHVPADYQIPKMLESLDCITYHPYLSMSITEDKLIPKNSKEECEIRSATILAMRELCKLTEWNIAEVDGYLFTKRHQATEKFHLTITTDY